MSQKDRLLKRCAGMECYATFHAIESTGGFWWLENKDAAGRVSGKLFEVHDEFF